VTQRIISIHFVMPAAAGHTATLQRLTSTKLTQFVWTVCSVRTWKCRKIPLMAVHKEPKIYKK